MASTTQLSLLDEPRTVLPEGLIYRPALITVDEEAELIAQFAALDFKPFEFHGYFGNRRTVSFGWHYDFASSRVRPAYDIPDFLLSLRDNAARFASLDPTGLEHALVTEYAPRAGIGWHRDRPLFDDVIGISLAAPCRFRLRKKGVDGWERAAIELAPRSGYLLRGPARRDWEHSIPPLDKLRYSVTFRSVKPSAKSSAR